MRAITAQGIHQEFHGLVGVVAGRDINVQISFNEVLNKLADAVEADPKVPLEEKQSLKERLKSLANNEWIRSTGTSLLAEIVKNPDLPVGASLVLCRDAFTIDRQRSCEFY